MPVGVTLVIGLQKLDLLFICFLREHGNGKVRHVEALSQQVSTLNILDSKTSFEKNNWIGKIITRLKETF